MVTSIEMHNSQGGSECLTPDVFLMITVFLIALVLLLVRSTQEIETANFTKAKNY